MSFKVGDRVEVQEPADGAITPKVGLGTVTHESDDDGHVRVQVDGTQPPPYYYGEDQLRLLETGKPFEPKPSIQVGAQVRLTGVVKRQEIIDDAVWVAVRSGFKDEAEVLIHPEHLEVIRQPFKRGEVVSAGVVDVVVVADEANGLMLIAHPAMGTPVREVESKDYERRP